MAPPKRLRKFIGCAEAQGWTYDETSDGHPRLTPPPGMRNPQDPARLMFPVTFSKTPSDHRGDKNSAAALKRCGVKLPGKDGTPGK